ncbi:MAG: hypothetical protein AAFV29_22225, partial [Myxococcota bacterium]
NDFDETNGDRPTFLNEAIDAARDSRESINREVVRNFEAQIAASTERLNSGDTSDEAITEALQLYQDAKRALDNIDPAELPDDIIRAFDQVQTELAGLQKAVTDAGGEIIEGDALETLNQDVAAAAEKDPGLAGLLGEGGRVHSAVKIGGKVFMVVGVLSDGYSIITADDKLGQAVKVTGGWEGAVAGAAAAEALVAPIATWFGPVGWVVDGLAGLVGGGVGYWAGESAAETLYDGAKAHHTVDDPQQDTGDIKHPSLLETLLAPFQESGFPDTRPYLGLD